MSDSPLPAISDLLADATPRPWTLGECSEDGTNWTPQVWPTGYGAPILRMSGRVGIPGRDETDAALIVRSVNAIDGVAALRSRLADWVLSGEGEPVSVPDVLDELCRILDHD